MDRGSVTFGDFGRGGAGDERSGGGGGGGKPVIDQDLMDTWYPDCRECTCCKVFKFRSTVPSFVMICYPDKFVFFLCGICFCSCFFRVSVGSCFACASPEEHDEITDPPRLPAASFVGMRLCVKLAHDMRKIPRAVEDSSPAHEVLLVDVVHVSFTRFRVLGGTITLEEGC